MRKREKFLVETRLGQVVAPKKRHWPLRILLILIIIAAIAIISVGLQSILQKNFVEDLATWTSSLPSYWGGIVGGVISGTISFLGVFLTIRYYRDSDLTRNRTEHMPFIHIKLVRAERIRVIKDEKENVIEVPGRLYEVDRKELVSIDLLLENIGNGFANTLVLHLEQNTGGEGYQRCLKVGDKEHLQLKFYIDDTKNLANIRFGLQYVDCMTNEYIQQYTVKSSGALDRIPADSIKKSVSIESGYPQFIGQIHQLGK